jgi:iron complex outermembrane receptor protein
MRANSLPKSLPASFLGLMASVSALAIAAPAFADEAPPAANTVREVVVTADKRPELIRNVPQAVTAVPEVQLERLQATNFQDYASLVPGMSLQQTAPGVTRIVLRGINSGGVGATLGTYMDETPYGSSSALLNAAIFAPDLDTFDMKQIEVLRGPQGTLYGASTLGGLLKFVTNAPSTKGYAGKLSVGMDEVDHGGTGWDVKGMINIPLGDKLAFRASGYERQDPGFVDDTARHLKDVNESRSTGGRASLLFTPSEQFSVRLTAIAQDLKSGGGPTEDLVPTTSGTTFTPLFGNYQFGRTDISPEDVRYRLYSGTADWNLGGATLTSTTSWGTLREFNVSDVTAAFGTLLVQHIKLDKFTEEVRLASRSDVTLEWLVGAYYTRESASLHQDLSLTPTAVPLGFVQLDSTYRESAIFGNATYHFSPRFDLSLGGRWAEDKQFANEFGLASANGGSSEHVFTWSAAPRFKLDDDTMIYGRIAKGFRPGGPNALPPGAPPNVPTRFAPDELINYEAGIKTQTPDHRFSLDVAAFHIDWKDIQLLTVIGGFGVNGNGGKASSDGIEWNAQFIPTHGLTLGWDGAYTDAKLTSDTNPLVGGKKGDPLPYAPKWTMALNGDYQFPAFGHDAFVGASWRYVGDRGTDYGSSAPRQRTMPSYSIIDLRAGIDIKRWTLEAYAKNLGDTRGFTAVGANNSVAGGATGPATPGLTAYLIQPRTIGLTLTARF